MSLAAKAPPLASRQLLFAVSSAAPSVECQKNALTHTDIGI
jgi:hypothetical protein